MYSSPHHKIVIVELEMVQKWTTQMIKGPEQFTYKSAKEFVAFYLRKKDKPRALMIEVYKTMHGRETSG